MQCKAIMSSEKLFFTTASIEFRDSIEALDLIFRAKKESIDTFISLFLKEKKNQHWSKPVAVLSKKINSPPNLFKIGHI